MYFQIVFYHLKKKNKTFPLKWAHELNNSYFFPEKKKKKKVILTRQDLSQCKEIKMGAIGVKRDQCFKRAMCFRVQNLEFQL